jgi:hypothetical protein
MDPLNDFEHDAFDPFCPCDECVEPCPKCGLPMDLNSGLTHYCPGAP